MRKSAPYLDGSLVGGIGAMAMDYLGGFHYQGTALKFFPTAEGYVQKTGTQYSYVYNYTDHLGNIRLSYAQDPENPNVLKIIEESHYYPFGLKHANYNSDQLAFKEKDPGPGLMLMAAPVDPVPQFNYDYKYNGKEFQDEVGLNWFDYGARNYDPAIGRWMNIDPLAEKSRRFSPYTYALNNPAYFIDPDGMTAEANGNQVTIDINIDYMVDTGYGRMRTPNQISGATESYIFSDVERKIRRRIKDGNKKNPPVHFFGNIGSPAVMAFYSALEKAFARTGHDLNFIAMGHGDSKNGTMLNFGAVNTKDEIIRTAEEFETFMMQKSPEFKKAVEQHQPFTLTLLVCWSATTLSENGSLAKQISDLYPWATIAGLDGRGLFVMSNKGNPLFLGIGTDPRPKGGDTPIDSNGSMVYYQNGIETYRIKSDTAKTAMMALIR